MSISFDAAFPTQHKVKATGKIKVNPEDFIVVEQSSIDFTDTGEHLWLWVKKTNTNTDWLAKQLVDACGVNPRAVGYAGLKDRHAMTFQWFSVQLPKTADIAELQSRLPTETEILSHRWHQRKIKTGQLHGNRFEIHIRNIQGSKETIDRTIKAVQQEGVPNYFGPQRFGRNMDNIGKAERLMSGQFKTRNKKLKSLLLSTARSHIFNAIIVERLAQNNWHKPILGDILQLDQSQSWFHAHEESEEQLHARLADGDIHLTAALWGENPVQSTTDCAKLEQSIAAQFEAYAPGFEQNRVKQDRRAMRLIPQNLHHEWIGEDLLLTFILPAGAYATTVLRELINLDT